MTFVTGDHVHLVGLDLATQHGLGLLALKAPAQLLRHALGIILVEAKLLGDLPI